MSLSRIRPKHVLLMSFITRDSCLCTKHQNMSLTLKAVRRLDINTSVNREKMLEIKEEVLKATQDTITFDDIVVRQWKHVPIECKGQKKMVMKIADMHMSKEEFVTRDNTG